jgi:cob(I)alamin adenosyltransferase
MKIYTKTGDDGTTSLGTENRIPKNSKRVCICGDLDELSSLIGLASSFSCDKHLNNILQDLQHDLYLLAACTAESNSCFDERKIVKLETLIDETSELLPPLKNFILPGGNKLASILHLARTVCRRTERSYVCLSEKEPIATNTIPYLNRLSDLLFVLARQANDGNDICCKDVCGA